MDRIHRIQLPEVESTNTYAKALDSGASFTLVSADYQTAGRGQRGNSWESERGQNLLFSLVSHPAGIPASQQFVLCELVSVALCDVLSRYSPDIRIKWPNDIYYRDEKLCGILIEHDVEGLYLSRTIMGVGLNVNQSRFVSDAPNPVSLCQVVGSMVEREELLEAIVSRFVELYERYTSSFPTLSRDALHHRYLSLLYRHGRVACYRDGKGLFTATLCDVALDGTLSLIDEQGLRRCYLFKEVEYVL